MKRKNCRLAFLVLALLLALQPVAGASAPYSRANPLLFTGKHVYTLANNTGSPATNITVALPGIYPDPFPYQVVVAARWNRLPAETRRDERGNVTYVFHIPRLEAGARAELVLEFLVQSFETSYSLEAAFGPFPPPHLSYLLPEEKIESTHPEIMAKAQQVTAGKTGDLEKARAIFAFVQQYMSYSTVNANKGALNALRTGLGVCEDYSSLFVALCRASGVPARLVYGCGFDLDRGLGQGHAWAEFHSPAHGWVPVEPTVISPQVPWHFFASLPPHLRNLPFSLAAPRLSGGWQGAGRVSISTSQTMRPGRHMELYGDISGHWAAAVISGLALQGITFSQGEKFEPSRPLTRAETARALVLANGLPPLFTPSGYRDVKESDWFHPYVQAATQAGIFGGFGDGTFRPHDTITREQLASVLSRSLGPGTKTEGEVSLSFRDLSAIAGWALPEVKRCVALGLFAGDDQNRFRPRDNTTRAEGAALIHRYLLIKNAAR